MGETVLISKIITSRFSQILTRCCLIGESCTASLLEQPLRHPNCMDAGADRVIVSAMLEVAS